MEKILKLFAILFLFISSLHSQNILTRTDSVKLTQADIWGGISYNGKDISITTTAAPTQAHLFLRRVDPELKQFGNPFQITFDSDPVAAKHITDHKHLFLNGCHFIAFSVAGDSDLYMFKVGLDGKRIGNIVPVVEHTANRTNDMMLATDGVNLTVAYFKPNQQSVVHTLDQNLQPVKPPIETSLQLPHNNLGTLFYKDSQFYMFTGTTAGPTSSLILTVWNSDWTPAIQQPIILIPAPFNEGLAFPTGIAYDTLRNYWFVGFHHMKNINPDANTHIDFAVFDSNFKLLEQIHRGPGFRPHFLVLGDCLYSVRDGGGVYLERFRIQGGAQPVEIPSRGPERFELFQNYPNPFNPRTRICYSLSRPSFVKLEIYSVNGTKLATLDIGNKDAGEYSVEVYGIKWAGGIIICRMQAGDRILTRKMVLIK